MTELTTRPSPSLVQQIAASSPAQFAQDNKILTTAAAGASGVILKQAADHSELAAKMLKKGATPALAAGVALLGSSLIQDGMKQGLLTRVSGPNGQEHTELNTNSLAKVGGGAALAAGGTEVAARSFGYRPLTTAAQKVAEAVLQPVVGKTLLAAPFLAIAALGAQDMRQEGVTLKNAAAVGFGSAAATGTLATAAFDHAAPRVAKIASQSAVVAGGAALGLGAYALGKQAHTSLKDGDYGTAALYTAGASTLGVLSVNVLGNATGVPLLTDLASRTFKRPLLAGSLALVGLTAGAYFAYSGTKTSSSTM